MAALRLSMKALLPSGMRNTTRRSRARASNEAPRSRRKLSALMAFSTFSAVSGRTPGRALSTRSTVASDTPAVRATSCTVARFGSTLSSTPKSPNRNDVAVGAARPSTVFGFERSAKPGYIRPRIAQEKTSMVAVKSFGSVNGKRVDQFTLTSTTGVEVDILNWGVVVRDWRVPVKTGGKRSVVLGLNSIEDYVQHSPHFGALAGRVANRIAGASFSLGDKTYTLPANNGPNSLHGGPEGIGRQVWEAEPDDATNSVVFSLTSPDGHSGYPGTVKMKATYRLDGNK